MWQLTEVLLSLLFVYHLGSAIFTTNPTNVTTCLGSPAVFTCVSNESITLSWFINGQQPPSQPPSTTLTPGPGQQSTLTISATSQLNGSSAQCFYFLSGSLTVVLSPSAYLSVQAPPAAPTNLINTPINATSTTLAWVPPPVQSPYLLSYVVEVSNGSGVLVYRGTVRVPQVTITTPDPCDQYEATVNAQYMMPNLTCTGKSSSKLLGAPLSVIQPTTSLMFPMSPQDTVTVNISLPYQSAGVCYYKTVAISGSEVYSFPSVKPLPQNGGHVTITISLPPNKHFTLIITASNGYGNTNSSVAISTFGVIGISVNTSLPTGLVCLFNPGSLATGCLVYLTDTAIGVIYCRVVGRSLDTPVNISLCPFSPSNGPLGTGVYYPVVVYVIESDGSVSSVPAITGEALSVFGSSAMLGPSLTPNTPGTPLSSSPEAIIGGVIGGILIIAFIIGAVITLCWSRNRKKKYDSGIVLAVISDSGPAGPTNECQPSQKIQGQYTEVAITKRPFIAPNENQSVMYADVKQVQLDVGGLLDAGIDVMEKRRKGQSAQPFSYESHEGESAPHEIHQEQADIEDEVYKQRQSKTKAEYIDVTFGILPHLAPDEGKPVIYSTVRQVKNPQTNNLSGDERLLDTDQELGADETERRVTENHEEVQAELRRVKQQLEVKEQELSTAKEKLQYTTKQFITVREQLVVTDSELYAVRAQLAHLKEYLDAIVAMDIKNARAKLLDKTADNTKKCLLHPQVEDSDSHI